MAATLHLSTWLDTHANHSSPLYLVQISLREAMQLKTRLARGSSKTTAMGGGGGGVGGREDEDDATQEAATLHHSSSIVGFGPGHPDFESRYPSLHHPHCQRHFPSRQPPHL